MPDSDVAIFPQHRSTDNVPENDFVFFPSISVDTNQFRDGLVTVVEVGLSCVSRSFLVNVGVTCADCFQL